MENPVENALPPQELGAQSNTEASCTLKDKQVALAHYELVKNRLLHPTLWHDLAGFGTADFGLFDKEGKPIDRTVQIGDFFRIDVPGPGPGAGDGYDWVQVEAIEYNEETSPKSVLVRVRPAPSPLNEKADVAHFFAPEASSNFMVCLDGTKVTAGVYGRNEKPNTDTKTIGDTLRNAAVATGALAGFSKLQWKRLVEGMIKL